MTKKIIEVEQYASLDGSDNGPVVLVGMFIGSEDFDEPNVVSFKTMLDEYVEANIIPGGTVQEYHREDLLFTLRELKQLIKLKMKEVKQLPQWEDKNAVYRGSFRQDQQWIDEHLK